MAKTRLVQLGQEIELGWGTVVLQPTSLCNLNCDYCYLPDRLKKARMAPVIARAVAEELERGERERLVLWHGGEPLATGIQHFRTLVEQFEGARSSGLCRHSIQTNATLIDEQWCELLVEYDFRVGISLDGTPDQNASRVYWSGRPAFQAAVRGVEGLKKAGIRFGVIAVVSRQNLDTPEQTYDFLRSLGPSSISISVEEREGLHVDMIPLDSQRVQDFWRRLLAAWLDRPTVSLRQFKDALNVVDSVSQGSEEFFSPNRNVYPTVGVNGDVVMLSPEFVSAPESERHRFVIGNVLHTDLACLVEKGHQAQYVAEFFNGVARCHDECEFFPFCRGGQASNKYFELGTVDATRTDYCQNSRIGPAQAMIEYLEEATTT